MKNTILLIILSILTLTSLAQNTTDNSGKAKAILDKLSTKNKSYTTIEAHFEFLMDNNEEDIHEKSNGTLLLKGDKYKLNIMGVDTYFDGTTIYSHIIDAEEVNIKEPDEDDEEEGLSPAKIFSIYEEGFNYKYVEEKIIKGKSYHFIDLFPTDLDKEFIKMTLIIDKKELQISTLLSKGKDGNNITINLNDFKKNIEILDKEFIFDEKANPNVEINDMR